MDTTFTAGDFRADDETFAPAARRRALDLVDGLRPIAERHGATVAQLVLAWNFHQPGVTSAIAGSRDPRHVAANAAAGDLVLDADTLGEIDALLG
jgi:aryl-alcohol dehydrogenase-like predicted oxidoreductase